MDRQQAHERMDAAIRLTAPGTALREAIDMILAAHLGALVCIGDTDRVLASGNDGFPLDIAFTANRLFELSKMDGAVVIDEDVTVIRRANFHLNPDPSLPTSETGMRHRTAARVSMATDAIVIAVSERRQVVGIHVGGHSFQLRAAADLASRVSQRVAALQSSRDSLDVLLTRLTVLEFDDVVTLREITRVFGAFQLLSDAADEIRELLPQLGIDGRLVRAQLEQLTSGMGEQYTLAVRDYARDPSPEEAARVRRDFAVLDPAEMASPPRVARILGYDGLNDEDVLTARGHRAISRAASLTREAAERVSAAYGSLPGLMRAAADDPGRLGELGVGNPAVFVSSLYRMWGRKG